MFNGFASWLAYIIALLQEVGSHLFVPNSGGFVWGRDAQGEWYLINASLPKLTENGKDIAGSMFTIFHNLMTYWAQISTLLPANALQG